MNNTKLGIIINKIFFKNNLFDTFRKTTLFVAKTSSDDKIYEKQPFSVIPINWADFSYCFMTVENTDWEKSIKKKLHRVKLKAGKNANYKVR